MYSLCVCYIWLMSLQEPTSAPDQQHAKVPSGDLGVPPPLPSEQPSPDAAPLPQGEIAAKFGTAAAAAASR